MVSMAAKKGARRTRRKFTPEFKADAVRLVLVEGKGIAEVARDLDLTESALRNWVDRAKADTASGKPGMLSTGEREELSALRKRVRELEVERELLKKWAAHSIGRCNTMQSTELKDGRNEGSAAKRALGPAARDRVGALARRRDAK